jgi:ATP-binding cassette subfamily B protein
VVLDKGKITSEGTHEELMKSSPIYREIYDSQLGGGVRL